MTGNLQDWLTTLFPKAIPTQSLYSEWTDDEWRGTYPFDRSHLLAGLLTALPEKGFVLSPDRLIRLQRVLAFLPEEAPVENLRDYLCPLFANNRVQQEQFRELFQGIVAVLGKRSNLQETPTGDTNPPPPEEVGGNGGDEGNTSEIIKVPPKERPNQPVNKAPLSLDLDQCTEPPYVWNITPKKEETKIVSYAGLNETLIQLRSREGTNLRSIDWIETVRASASRAGMPVVKYRTLTRPVEYLILIERFSLDDHRALLFDQIYQSLRKQDVLIDRYYHDGDLRVCHNEKFPKGILLRELRHRHAEARLIVLGSGYKMLSAHTGNLAGWTKTISFWPLRALLTPVSKRLWGYREKQLKELFTLLPAAWESIRYLSQIAPNQTYERFAELPASVRSLADRPPVKIQSPAAENLMYYFDVDICRWVAACAVWPSLHFDLTIQLGELVDPKLPTLENITKVSSIHWFVNGYIPRDNRNELIRFLKSRYPSLLQEVCAHLLELLERNVPQNPKSVAFAEHQINIAILNLMASGDSDPDAVQRLRTVLKRLNREADLADFVLPSSVEQMIQKLGLGAHAQSEVNPPDELPRLHALLIGIDTYDNPAIPKLNGCVNDIGQFYEYLTESQREVFNVNIVSLQNEHATKENIVRKIKEFLQKPTFSEDVFLIYFAGNGTIEPLDPSIWPADTKPFISFYACDSILQESPSNKYSPLSILEIEYIFGTTLKNRVKPHILLITDCCLPSHKAPRLWSNFIFSQTIESKELRQRGMYEIFQPVPYVLLTACEEYKNAYESNGSGIFSKYLLEVLKESGGMLSYEKIISRVRQKISFTSFKQQPQLIDSTGVKGIGFLGRILLEDTAAMETRNTLFAKHGKWIVNLGSLHGVPTSSSTPVLFAVYHIGDSKPFTEVQAIQVGFQDTEVSFSGDHSKEYDAKLISQQEKGLQVASDMAFLSRLKLLQKDYPALGPSFAVLSMDTPDARYGLKYLPDQIHILRPGGALVKGYSSFPDQEYHQFLAVVEDLDHIAKWHRIVTLDKSSAALQSEDCTLELRYENTNRIPVEATDYYTIEMNKKDRVPFSLYLKNPSNKQLHCAVFYLSVDYSVHVLTQERMLSPAAEIELYSGKFELSVEEEEFHIKVIVSTEPVDSHELSQEALSELGHLSTAYSSRRGREKSYSRRGVHWASDKSEWFSKTISIRLVESVGNESPIPNIYPKGPQIIEVQMTPDAASKVVFEEVKKPVKLLFTAATPRREGQINTGLESRLVDKIRLSDGDRKFKIRQEHGLDKERFRDLLIIEDPHIIHFAGHGSYEGLALEDSDIDADVLIDLIWLLDNTQLVVLNACYTLPMAKEIAKYVPYVIGTQGPLDDDAAIAFARSFYTGIAGGRDIESSFWFGLDGIKAAKAGSQDILVLVKGLREQAPKSTHP